MGVGGVSDLSVLLASMAPELRPGSYVFGTVVGPEVATELEVLASISEPEGLSVVVTREEAARCGWAPDFVVAWITLRVHSALHAVGLTAAVSNALAQAGMSCNVIAGHHHDHLLVPRERAEEALGLLRDLARDEASRAPLSARTPPLPAPGAPGSR